MDRSVDCAPTFGFSGAQATAAEYVVLIPDCLHVPSPCAVGRVNIGCTLCTARAFRASGYSRGRLGDDFFPVTQESALAIEAESYVLVQEVQAYLSCACFGSFLQGAALWRASLRVLEVGAGLAGTAQSAR